MATIEKRGDSFRIIVSGGYTADGKQIRERMTWTPPEGMSGDKALKEALKQAALFEDKIRQGHVVDSKMKLETFINEKYLPDYAERYLKRSTRAGYKRIIKGIITALGHMKLCDIRPTHINTFYGNLQEEGMRQKTTATSKGDLTKVREASGLSKQKLADLAGVSISVIIAAERGNNISLASAEKIAKALEAKTPKLFNISKDPTPLSDRTVLSYHRVLSGIMSKAVKWEYINFNPCVKTEHPTDPQTEAPYLEENEARRFLLLLQNEPIQWRTPISFDLFSGLRRGELVGLKWDDVDLDRQLLQVRQTFNYQPGYGAYEDTTKSHASKRPMKLSRAAVLLLAEYRAWQDGRRELLGDAWENVDNRIFTTNTGRAILPGRMTNYVTDFIKRTDLPHITLHSLRHTYASLLISDSVPITVISHQLGHSKPSTTTNFYGHLIASAEAKAQDTIDSRFEDIVAPPKSRASGA